MPACKLSITYSSPFPLPFGDADEEDEVQADDQVEDALSRYSTGQDKDVAEELDDFEDV